MTDALELAGLPRLMQFSSGRTDIAIALIDGPVCLGFPDLWSANVQPLGGIPAICANPGSGACTHGTHVASVLAARRGSGAPAICPDCTFLIRPVFSEVSQGAGEVPRAASAELAQAILDAVRAGARLINLSLYLSAASARDERRLEAALSYAAARGVIVAAAAGSDGEVGGSVLARHPWPIPVAGSDGQGRPSPLSNLGRSIGARGLLAPSENIPSLDAHGRVVAFNGTSAAAPFVSGAIALLWSLFHSASAADMKLAVTGRFRGARSSVVPPLLDAWESYEFISQASSGRKPS